MSAPLNNQVGRQLVTRRPPQFDGYIVVGGTWKPQNLLANEPSENEDEEVFHYSFRGPGQKVTCQLMQQASPPVTDLQPSQVITEVATDENPNPGTWLILKADPINFGKRKLIFDMEMVQHDALDATETS